MKNQERYNLLVAELKNANDNETCYYKKTSGNFADAISKESLRTLKFIIQEYSDCSKLGYVSIKTPRVIILEITKGIDYSLYINDFYHSFA